MIPVLKEGIRNIDIKKIFDNRTRKIEYLERLFSKTDSNFEIPRSVTGLDNCIIDTWDYNLSKDILREMFFCSKKFLSGLDCKKEVDFLINDWYDNNLGEIEWPFSAMIFDSYVARLNRRNDLSETEKDEIIAEDVVKFRRIKDINTEGCNNKIKVLKRNAYGYRNFKRFRNRILHMFSHQNKPNTENQVTD